LDSQPINRVSGKANNANALEIILDAKKDKNTQSKIVLHCKQPANSLALCFVCAHQGTVCGGAV
jgi:hypothetical protein